MQVFNEDASAVNNTIEIHLNKTYPSGIRYGFSKIKESET